MAHLPTIDFASGADAPAPDKAVASHPQTSGDATADLSCIGEIFVGARKLEQLPGIFDQAAYTPADELAYVELKLRDDPNERDLPEIPAGLWAEFDPLPLFLQMAG